MSIYVLHVLKIAAVYFMVQPIGFLLCDNMSEFKTSAFWNAVAAAVICFLTALNL